MLPLLRRLPQPLLKSAFIAAVLVVFALTMMPLPEMTQVVSSQDKFEHAIAFLVLMLLGAGGWPARVGRIAGRLGDERSVLAFGRLQHLAQAQRDAVEDRPRQRRRAEPIDPARRHDRLDRRRVGGVVGGVTMPGVQMGDGKARISW